MGLDHISFSVSNQNELEQASRSFDELGVSRGEIKSLADLGIVILPFRDPDNIQLELTAPSG